MDRVQFQIPKDKIAELCRRYHICKLSVFGSALRNDFRPDSDVDVLVEFKPGQTVGFQIFEIEEELSRILNGHPVDLINPKYLNPRLRTRILEEAELQYAEG